MSQAEVVAGAEAPTQHRRKSKSRCPGWTSWKRRRLIRQALDRGWRREHAKFKDKVLSSHLRECMMITNGSFVYKW